MILKVIKIKNPGQKGQIFTPNTQEWQFLSIYISDYLLLFVYDEVPNSGRCIITTAHYPSVRDLEERGKCWLN